MSNFDRDFDRMHGEFRAMRRVTVGGALVSGAVSLAVIAGIAYVIWHFLQRVW